MRDNPDNERDYQRAARLLGRTLPREQVEEYLRKIEIAAQKDDQKEPRRDDDGENQ